MQIREMTVDEAKGDMKQSCLDKKEKVQSLQEDSEANKLELKVLGFEEE